MDKCVRELFIHGDFNVYGSPLSNNIRLSHRITLTDVHSKNVRVKISGSFENDPI